MPCDDFFNNAGIPFQPAFQNAAVRAVKIADFYDPIYKKWLIQCWFDTTYGTWNYNRADVTQSRRQMSAFIQRSKYDTFEELLADTTKTEA